MSEINTIEEFERAVDYHDLTHAYSDDHRVWSRGSADRKRILAAAKKFPAADVERIWNAMVDRKLVENARSSFYWRG